MVSIELNITALVQIINFLIALIVVNFLIVKPIRGVLKQRRDMLNGFVGDAERFKKEAATRLERYQEELDEARAAAAADKEAVKQKGLDEEQRILADAQSRAQSSLAEAKARLAGEVESAKRELRGKVNAMAGKIVSRVLE